MHCTPPQMLGGFPEIIVGGCRPASSPAALPGSASVVISSQKFNLRFCTDHYGELPPHWSTLAVIPA